MGGQQYQICVTHNKYDKQLYLVIIKLQITFKNSKVVGGVERLQDIKDNR